MNVALSELPDFTCRPGKTQQDHHGSGIVIGPTLDYLERAYLDARAHGWSRQPVVEMLIPSTLDPTLAPAGQHVASLFVQYVAPQLPDGRSWDDAKEAFADLVIDTVTAHAPNFKSSVIARQVLSPLDLERRFGLVDGDIFHGQMTLGSAVQRQAGAWPCRLPHAAAGPLPVRVPARIPVAASPACRGATRPGDPARFQDIALGSAVWPHRRLDFAAQRPYIVVRAGRFSAAAPANELRTTA